MLLVTPFGTDNVRGHKRRESASNSEIAVESSAVAMFEHLYSAVQAIRVLHSHNFMLLSRDGARIHYRVARTAGAFPKSC